MNSTLYLYNTLHRQKEEFKPINPPNVGFYSCGPTVYDFQHIGNMRAFLTADLLKRVLLYNGYDVTHIMNITDVGHLVSDGDEGQDKMEKGARREGKTVWEIAEYYTDNFKNDITSLNIIEPVKWTKATDYIKEQIDLIKRLEKKGYTYVIDDGVYFDSSKFSTYGQMAKLNLEKQQEGARVAINDQKRNPSDFALWKFSPKNEQRAMEWESPWGKGFPGWHIECSAMSMKYLGETFDIHSGGIDHIPVHHTNEIAQSEAATDKPLANYWIHNEHLVLSGKEKMAKSKGNFVTLQTTLDKGYQALDYRFATMQTHYRGHMTFSWAVMDAAREGRERLNQFVRTIYKLRNKPDGDLDALKKGGKYLSDKQDKFLASINDDLNAPGALAVVFDLVKDVNSQITNNELSVSADSIWEWLKDIDKILGLNFEIIATAANDLPPKVKELLARRQTAREQKDFESSDRLRSQLKELGYLVEDTEGGQQTKPL